MKFCPQCGAEVDPDFRTTRRGLFRKLFLREGQVRRTLEYHFICYECGAEGHLLFTRTIKRGAYR